MPPPDLVTQELRGSVLLVQVDNPPVNALSPGVPEGLVRSLEAADVDDAVTAVVIAGEGKTFVAGADISTLEDAAWGNAAGAPDLGPLLTHIETCTKPVVMALHGTVLGGGLELAMAGHFRVAHRDTQLGQPEVNLGIIPGAQGTQRLPRLIGVERALELCVTGRPMKARDALAAGLIDAVLDEDLIGGAVAFAEAAVQGHRPLQQTSMRTDRLGSPAENAPRFEAARALAAKIRPQQVAPLKAIEAIEAAATLPFVEGCRRERELFFECVRGDQAKAMIHLFFAERAVGKIPGLPKDTPTAPLAKIGIIGAGTMGGGIAMACANAGLHVRIKDVSADAVSRGLDTIRRNYDFSVKRGRLTPEAVSERMARIHGQTDYQGFDDVDLIVEAAFESLALKTSLFRDLDRVAKPSCILGTNTSTLDIDAIAAATSRPASVIGLHFFSPANVMRLLEVVRGRASSPTTIATALAFGKRLGKVGVLVGNCRGFVGNRMMFPYMYETQYMVEEGATPEQVDRALTEFGMAMGMFAVDDMAGIDVAQRVMQELGHFTDGRSRRPLVQTELFKMGRLGQKTGAGWYRYDDTRKPIPDPDVVELIRELSVAAHIPQRSFTNAEIVDRAILALVNEGARALGEGFALRASDIDVIYTSGYGFPARRGGPMMYAQLVGLPAVLARIRAFEQEFGARWSPAPLLVELADQHSTFREYDAKRRS